MWYKEIDIFQKMGLIVSWSFLEEQNLSIKQTPKFEMRNQLFGSQNYCQREKYSDLHLSGLKIDLSQLTLLITNYHFLCLFVNLFFDKNL